MPYIIRLPEVLRIRARKRSTHYVDIQQGLFTRPVSIGAKAVGWPSNEVEVINAARIAGKTDEEIRALVIQLEASRTMSATNHGARHQDSDFYATPPDAIDVALRQIDWSHIHSFCEPCKGDGRIIESVQRCADLKIDWYESLAGRDYLDSSRRTGAYDLTMTNPPFSSAQRFIERACAESRNVLMLLRLDFLGSQKRLPFWEQHPCSHLFVLSKRPSFTGGGIDATEYAWFGWGADFTRPPGIYVEGSVSAGRRGRLNHPLGGTSQ